MKHIKIGKDAAVEFEEAAAWYEMVQPGLGDRFIFSVRARTSSLE